MGVNKYKNQMNMHHILKEKFKYCILILIIENECQLNVQKQVLFKK